MKRKSIDLFLGGDLGIWVLSQIQNEDVARVFTLDDSLSQQALKQGLDVTMENPNTIEYEAAQVAFSVHYNRILKHEVLKKYEKTYNLHPGYLPWGRGFYPIFWALWENTPAGATLHEMAEKVDQGPVIAQIQVSFAEYETGYAVFERVREAEKTLFKKYYNRILTESNIPSNPQKSGGTYHSKKEFMQLKQPKHWKSLNADSLIRLSRYLTFPGYTGVVIHIDNQPFEVFVRPQDSS